VTGHRRQALDLVSIPIMGRQVALLRGINVGGHNKIPMAELRELMQELGYEDVRTHLQSGNALFTADRSPVHVAEEIEARISERFGLDVRVLVRSRDELAWIVAANPLSEVASDPKRFLVAFLSRAPARERLDELAQLEIAPDVLGVGERGMRELYMWCPAGVHEAKLTYAQLEKRLGVVATARNWNTVTKLLALADG
jgi:uncharacterized protein (DUF1697 family)